MYYRTGGQDAEKSPDSSSLFVFARSFTSTAWGRAPLAQPSDFVFPSIKAEGPRTPLPPFVSDHLRPAAIKVRVRIASMGGMR
jgi:hypothetical protein